MGLLTAFLDILFPPKCVFCSKIVASGSARICPQCRDELPYTMGDASRSGDFFSLCVSPLYYEDNVRDSLLRYKFHGGESYAAAYGELLAECIARELTGCYDVISWVPLSKKRLRERGYDQAFTLAREAAALLGEKAVPTLIKHRHVPRQSGIGSPEKRRANISGAYSVVDRERIAGKRILLIDDIITSGSTLSECARILLGAGAGTVVCATLARGRD